MRIIMKVSFVHGTTEKFDEFKYFNVHHRSDGKVLDLDTGDELTGNGVDAGGMGVYGVRGTNASSVSTYSGDDGYVYVLSAEIDDFANNVPADEIDPDDWRRVCDVSIELIDKLHGFEFDAIYAAAEGLEFGNNEQLSEFKESLARKNIDSYYLGDFSGYDCIEDWLKEFEEAMLLVCPSSSIREEIACVDFNDLIQSSESLWGVMVRLNIMMSYNDEGRKYFNESFYQAYKEVIGSHEGLVMGKMPSFDGKDDVVICFDLDEIKIERVIDLSLRNEKKKPSPDCSLSI
jgi:hypothetical protein